MAAITDRCVCRLRGRYRAKIENATAGTSDSRRGRVMALILVLGLIVVSTVLATAWGRPPEAVPIIAATPPQLFNDPARPRRYPRMEQRPRK